MEILAYWLFVRRLKKIYRQGISYELQKVTINKRLLDYFLGKGKSVNGLVNNIIYKKAITFFKNEGYGLKQGVNDEWIKTQVHDSLDAINNRYVDQLIERGKLLPNADFPIGYKLSASYEIWVKFRWFIIELVGVGLLVGIAANLISNFIWEKIK